MKKAARFHEIAMGAAL